ncbi:MAG: DUF7065 domain-containing protein [Acidimicrobiia bacterium]
MTPAREYPTFGPEDDDFHDAVMSDRWWETETCWFSWNVPERKLGGWTYCQARPNARLCNGGVWVWDDAGAYAWELPYHVNYSGLELPDERDLRDFEWPNGVHVRCLEPLTTYEITYADLPDLELSIVFDALMPPNPHPVGVPPLLRGTHFDQPGHVTGEMALRGERIAIDCLAMRDRTWGPRPQGRPKRKPTRGVDTQHTGAGGVGYSFGTASADDGFLVYSIPGPAADPVMCGYLMRGGQYAHILSGSRSVRVDPETGWPVRIEIEAVDDAGREVHVVGDAVSRYWRGHGGDTLMRWRWDGVDEGWGEDQSYFSKRTWLALRERAG